MTKLISPQGTEATVSETQVEALQRIGWKRPEDLVSESIEADETTGDEGAEEAEADSANEGADEASDSEESDEGPEAEEAEAEKKPAAKRGRPRKSE